MSTVIIHNLMIILIAGLISGIVSKRFGIPMVIGYLLAGAVIGEGGFDLFAHGDYLKNKENRARVVLEEAIRETWRHDAVERLKSVSDRKGAQTSSDERGFDVASPDKSAADKSGGVKNVATEKMADAVVSSGLKETFGTSGGVGNSTAGTNASAEKNGVSAESLIETAEEKAAEQLMDTVVTSEEFQKETIDQLANLGALFLLFSIGIHFAPSELFRIKKFLLVGGPLQMFGVIIPLTVVTYLMNGDWRTGLLIGFAVSLSSTVLVFKSLEDFGQAASPYGTRAISILLFQDIATAPILLIIPLLFSAGTGNESVANTFMMMGAKALFFIVLIVGIRLIFTTRGIKLFAQLKSVELMVLFTIVLLFVVCLIADRLELPDAIGAFAAGVALSENRLSGQISALSIPFRETFSAIFFVSLGALLDPQVLFDHPESTLGLLAAMLLLKTLAGGIAFKLLGLAVIPAFAMGLGIAQLGELSFIILQQGPFKAEHPVLYQQLLFVALSSIILTPLFLKIAMNVVRKRPVVENPAGRHREMLLPQGEGRRSALVVGLGPIGQRVTSFLEISGVDVCLIDMNPVNLQPYAQEGFRTIAGDATEAKTLKHAEIDRAKLVVITIPNDLFATDTIQTIRSMGQDCSIVARCRYTASIHPLKKAGADIVICEETEAGGQLVETLEPLI